MMKSSMIDIPYVELRPYQVDFWNKFIDSIIEKKNDVRTFIINASRRSGKDTIAMNAVAAKALVDKGTYLILFPTIAAAKRTMVTSLDAHTGLNKVEEAFGPFMVHFNKTTMEIILINGSNIILGGVEDAGRYRGMGVKGVVISEYAHCPQSIDVDAIISPMLVESDGFKIYITTPNGHNHFHNLVKRVLKGKDPYTYYFFQPVSVTKHLTTEQLEKSLTDLQNSFGDEMGEMIFDQEYNCGFHEGSLSSVYSKYEIDSILAEEKIHYDPLYPLYVVMDLGWSDNNALWVFQIIDGRIYFIDAYQNNRKPIAHYTDWIKRNYNSDAIVILPHDGRNETLAGDGNSIEDMIKKLGFTVEHVPRSNRVNERILTVRSYFKVIKINSDLDDGIHALRNYSFKLLKEEAIMSSKPKHDAYSDYADSFGYGVQFADILQSKKKKRGLRRFLPDDFMPWPSN